MNNQTYKTKQLALYGMCIALAFILSYVEAMLPFPMPMPGMKVGLTNLVVMIALFYMRESSAFVINLTRIFLVSMTFGNMMTLWYSLAGGILSFVAMLILKRTNKFSMVSVSVIGGVSHNVGQILVAMYVLQTTKLYWYLSVLSVSGVVAGIVIGVVASLILDRLPKLKLV